MASEFDLHYALLNEQQRQAVDHVDGPMLVLAGAGTGKTQIIALRIAKLLATQDLQPRNILCLTFTESGVQAMRERLVKLLGAIGYQVKVSTFHGFCNEVITAHPELFLQQSAFEQITDLDRILLIQSLIQDLPADSPLKPFGAPDFYIADILRAIQTLKRENTSPDQLSTLIKGTELTKQTEKQLPKQQALVEVYRQYQTTLRERQQYDYEDMILYVIQAFAEQPELLAEYQEQFLYLLADEFQDTNGAQNEVLRLLGGHQTDPNLFVVGDDRQSIFRFQGAALENILAFQQRYGATAKIISLQMNYRSQQTILDGATGLIRNNQHSLEQYIPALATQLQSARDIPRQPIEIAALASSSAEWHWLTQRIQALMNQGVSASDIAVLCRTNMDADLVFDHLKQVSIPVHLAAGSNVLIDPLIAQFLRLLAYVGLGGSDEMLFSISQFKFLQLPTASVAKAAHQASTQHGWLWQAFQTNDDLVLQQFAERLLGWRQAMHNTLCTEWFTAIANESGWIAHVLKTEHHLEHLNRLATVYHAVLQMTKANHQVTIQEVIEYFNLLQKHDLALEEEPLATHRQAVQVYTAHRAKGLEFAHVFIVRCLDKKWGNVVERAKLKLPEGLLQFTVEEMKQEKNEDERRLFYVAMTRAKQGLYLSYATQTDSGRASLPSQFLAELPSACIQLASDTEQVDALPEQRLVATFTQPSALSHTLSHDDELRDYVLGLLQNYRMSATHLNDYLECPFLFLYQDILRVPRSMTRAVGFGIAVHNALRLARTTKEIVAVFKTELDKQLLTATDYKDSLAFGQMTLKEYVPEHLNWLKQNQFPEKDFKPYGVMVAGVPITGKIDAIHVLNEEEKTVHVVDYKTGNPDNKSADLAVGGKYYRQLVFYKLLCDHAPEFGYTAQSGEIHFIQKSKKKNTFVHRQYEFTDTDVETVTAEIVGVYTRIQQLDFLQPKPEELCGDCTWCTMLKL